MTPWTGACQAPLSMEFSRKEYWNGLPFPSPGDLHNPGIEPRSPSLQADSLPSEIPGGSPYNVGYNVGAQQIFVGWMDGNSVSFLVCTGNDNCRDFRKMGLNVFPSQRYPAS